MGRDRRSLLTPARLALLLALVWPALALAQSKRAQARAHFAQAEAYFKAAAFDRAAEEYLAAYDLVPKPVLLFNAALAYENFGDREQAIAYYERYLTADPAGAKVAEARARQAGISRARPEEPEPAPLEPAPQPPVVTPVTAPATAVTVVDRGSSPRLWPGLVVAGSGVALAGIGVAFYLQAGRVRDDLTRDLANGTPPLDSRDPRIDSGRATALRATIFLGLGSAAFVVGGVLTARALLAPRRAPALSLLPSVSRRGATLTVEGRW